MKRWQSRPNHSPKMRKPIRKEILIRKKVPSRLFYNYLKKGDKFYHFFLNLNNGSRKSPIMPAPQYTAAHGRYMSWLKLSISSSTRGDCGSQSPSDQIVKEFVELGPFTILSN